LRSTVALVDLESGDLITAPLLAGQLWSAAARQLATALRVDARVRVTDGAELSYDAELSSAAKTAGIEVRRPRQSGAPVRIEGLDSPAAR